MSRSDFPRDLSSSPDGEDDDARLIAQLRAAARLEDAPEALIERTIALFAQPSEAAISPTAPARATGSRAPAQPWRAALRRLADWLHDSGFVAAPALGLRAAGARMRQLASEVDLGGQALTIDLQITAAPDGAAGWMLAGQLFGPESTGTLTLQVGAQRYTAPVDEFGEFRAGPLPSGRWQIDLQLDLGAGEGLASSATITLAPVDVEPGVGG